MAKLITTWWVRGSQLARRSRTPIIPPSAPVSTGLLFGQGLYGEGIYGG